MNDQQEEFESRDTSISSGLQPIPPPPPLPPDPPYAGDKEESPKRMRLDLSAVEMKSPLWRVLAVAAFVAAFVALGMYLGEKGNAEAVALVAVVALAKIAGYWANFLARVKPPKKAGTHVPTELRRLGEAVRKWLNDRPIVICCFFGVAWGIATLISKNLMTVFFEQLYSPWLSICVGCLIGAVIAAPEFFKSGIRKMGWSRES